MKRQKKRIVHWFLAEERIILRQNCENKKKGRCIDFLVEPGKEKRGNKEVLFGRCVQMMSQGRFLMVGGGGWGVKGVRWG